MLRRQGCLGDVHVRGRQQPFFSRLVLGQRVRRANHPNRRPATPLPRPHCFLAQCARRTGAATNKQPLSNTRCSSCDLYTPQSRNQAARQPADALPTHPPTPCLMEGSALRAVLLLLSALLAWHPAHVAHAQASNAVIFDVPGELVQHGKGKRPAARTCRVARPACACSPSSVVPCLPPPPTAGPTSL